MIQENKYYIS